MLRKYFSRFAHMCALLVTFASFVACDDKDDFEANHNNREPAVITNPYGYESSDLLEANRFVYEVMDVYYYWADEMPNINYRTQNNTENYFYSLLSDKDRFSFISDDADAEEDADQGKFTSMGWLYTAFRDTDDPSKILALITYTYEDSPARKAGVRRGDILTAVDGQTMTASNYYNLINAESGKFTFLRHQADTTVTEEYVLQKEEIIEDPVAETQVLTTESGKKVGYLLYNSYKSAFNGRLDAAAQRFKDEQITDLILDLRYNPGGDMDACRHLCSLIAPEADVKAKKELIYYHFNDFLTQTGIYTRENFHEEFDDSVSVNLNLDHLVVLTGANTYSASEATIWGLKPYMDVVMVGDTTGGKNSMMFIMTPDIFVDDDDETPLFSPSINNWYLAPIVGINYNTTGETFDTSNGRGLAPDIYVDEFSKVSQMGQLGTTSDPLTARALEYIETGNTGDNKSLATHKPKMLYSGGVDGRGGAWRRISSPIKK